MTLWCVVCLQIGEQFGSVRTLTPTSEGELLVGTVKNFILSGKPEGPAEELRVLVSGHTDELWGLATHPQRHQFLTVCYDKSLILWDSLTHSAIWTKEINVCPPLASPRLLVARSSRQFCLCYSYVGPGALGGVLSVGRSDRSGHEERALAGGGARHARDARLAHRRQWADRVSRVLAWYAFLFSPNAAVLCIEYVRVPVHVQVLV